MSNITREMQIKTRYHYTPIKMSKKKKTGNKNDGNDVEQQEILLIADGNAKYCSHFGRHFGIFLQR